MNPFNRIALSPVVISSKFISYCSLGARRFLSQHGEGLLKRRCCDNQIDPLVGIMITKPWKTPVTRTTRKCHPLRLQESSTTPSLILVTAQEKAKSAPLRPPSTSLPHYDTQSRRNGLRRHTGCLSFPMTSGVTCHTVGPATWQRRQGAFHGSNRGMWEWDSTDPPNEGLTGFFRRPF